MKKDIEMPSSEGVALAFVPDKDADGKKIWTVGIYNERSTEITNVIINASGVGRIKGVEKQTASIRFLIDAVPGGRFKSFEILVKDSIELSNTYWVSFFEGDRLCDKKFVVPPKFLALQKKELITPLRKPGVVVR